MASSSSSPAEVAPNASLSTTTTTPTRSTGGGFAPGPDWILLSQGAEARIWKLPTPPLPEPHNDHNDQRSSSVQPQQQQHDDNDDAAVRGAPRAVPVGVAGVPQQQSWIICKERFSKSYRHRDLDERLTKQRCRMEARLLNKCTLTGTIRVPKVVQVVEQHAKDYPEPALLFLEYLEGQTTVRDYLEDSLLLALDKQDIAVIDGTSTTAALDRLARDMGSTVARLHSAGMIHGDLTTSNMMIHNGCKNDDDNDSGSNYNKDSCGDSSIITLIDFGLAKNTTLAEERAVDLYVLERALQSTHPTLPDQFWEMALQAYKETTIAMQEQSSSNNTKNSNKGKQDTLSRLEQVRQRGRKRECFG